jgi:anti-sigma factor RsiW
MTTPDLTCQELVELVTAYLEGALPEAEHARFEEHLADCEGCAAYVEQMRRTIELLGELRTDDVEPEAEHALLATFRDWRRVSPP